MDPSLRYSNCCSFYINSFASYREVRGIWGPKSLKAVQVTFEKGTNGPWNSSLFLPLWGSGHFFQDSELKKSRAEGSFVSGNLFVSSALRKYKSNFILAYPKSLRTNLFFGCWSTSKLKRTRSPDYCQTWDLYHPPGICSSFNVNSLTVLCDFLNYWVKGVFVINISFSMDKLQVLIIIDW